MRIFSAEDILTVLELLSPQHPTLSSILGFEVLADAYLSEKAKEVVQMISYYSDHFPTMTAKELSATIRRELEIPKTLDSPESESLPANVIPFRTRNNAR